MFGIKKTTIYLICSYLLLVTHSVYANQTTERISKKLQQNHRMHFPREIISSKKIEKIRNTIYVKNKAKLIFKKASSSRLLQEKLTYRDIENTVAFVFAVKKKISKSWFKNASTEGYYHPDEIKTRIPVQFYENGRVYLHFKNFDTGKKFGSYKSFSRSIDFDTGEIYANLVGKIRVPKNGDVLLRELKMMEALDGVGSALNFRDASVYFGKDKSKLLKKISIQTNIYEGDLSDFELNSSSEDQLFKISYDLALALKRIHSHGIIHRDLKPKNIFYRKKNRDYELVVADFGLSEMSNSQDFGRHLAGSGGYIDPRICLQRLKNSWACRGMRECQETDYFSLGMLLYKLSEGQQTRFKKLLTNINKQGLHGSKGSSKDILEVSEKIDELSNIHSQINPKNYSLSEQSNMFKFKFLVWQLINPDFEDRISIDDFIYEVRKLY